MGKWSMQLCAAALALASSPAFAKRIPPKPVAPVTAKGVVYKAPHFGVFHGKDQNGGFVQAWDAKTKKLLWDRMVYRVIYDRDLETDVQDVFITKLRVVGDKLVVTNEASEKFEMDLPSGRVRALTALGTGGEAGRREVPTPESTP